VEGRHLGFPCFPYSVISMACFGNAFHKFTIRSEGPFWEQEPLVRDGDFSAMWLLNTSGPGDKYPIPESLLAFINCISAYLLIEHG
jgi:hypothetical protein